VQGLAGRCQGVRSEGCLDRGAHGADVDPDDGERVPVEVPEQGGPGSAGDFRLDPSGRDAVLAQDGPGRLVRGGQGEQEMLAAEVAVPEPEGMLISDDRDGDRVRGHTSNRVNIC